MGDTMHHARLVSERRYRSTPLRYNLIPSRALEKKICLATRPPPHLPPPYTTPHHPTLLVRRCPSLYLKKRENKKEVHTRIYAYTYGCTNTQRIRNLFYPTKDTRLETRRGRFMSSRTRHGKRINVVETKEVIRVGENVGKFYDEQV